MAITLSTNTGITSAQKIIVAEAQFTAQYDAPMTNLVTKYTLKKGEKSIVVPKYGALSATALTEGTDISSATTVTMTVTTITTSEAGLMVILTDKLIRQMNDDVFRSVGRILGDALADIIDEGGVDMFSGFDVTMGSAGTNLAVSHFSAAQAKLVAAKAPGPYVAVIHPYQAHRVRTGLAPSGTYPLPAGLSSELLRQYQVGQVFGVPVFEDGRIDIDANNDAYGAIFNRAALAFTVEKEYDVETQRDASLRAWELVCVADYSWNEINGTYGCYLFFDASVPTS